MRDRHADRVAKKRKVKRIYDTKTATVTSFGVEKPYNELLAALESYSGRTFIKASEQKIIARLAWFLGQNGESDACAAIMKHIYIYGEMK